MLLTKLIIPELNSLYSLSNKWPIWSRHLLLGLLVWLQDRYLTVKIEQTVTDAIDEYTKQVEPVESNNWIKDAKITITENPDSLHQLPTLTISAPYSSGFTEDDSTN